MLSPKPEYTVVVPSKTATPGGHIEGILENFEFSSRQELVKSFDELPAALGQHTKQVSDWSEGCKTGEKLVLRSGHVQVIVFRH